MGSDTELKLVDLMRYYVAETESVKELLIRLKATTLDIFVQKTFLVGSTVLTIWTGKIEISKRQKSRIRMYSILRLEKQ